MVEKSDIDYIRLQDLSNKVRNKSATSEEKDEYMLMLLHNKSITEKQYNDYIEGKNKDEIISTALGIGAIVILGYLLAKLFDD